MRNMTFLVMATAFFVAGCASNPKLDASNTTCINIDTSDTLYSYTATDGKQQMLNDISKRLNKYLVGDLKERGITVSDTCKQGRDVVLTVRLDDVEPYIDRKLISRRESDSGVLIKYSGDLVSPTGVKLTDFDGDEKDENLDDLINSFADSIYDEVKGFYPKK